MDSAKLKSALSFSVGCLTGIAAADAFRSTPMYYVYNKDYIIKKPHALWFFPVDSGQKARIINCVSSLLAGSVVAFIIIKN